MARIEIIEFRDDLNNKPGEDVKTRRFGFGGTDFEIDLNDANYEALEKVLSKYIAVARVAKPAPAGKSKGKSKSALAVEQKKRNDTIRAWAKSQGMTVSDRGRPANKIVEAWMAAGQPQPPFEAPVPDKPVKAPRKAVKASADKPAAPRKRRASKAQTAAEPVEAPPADTATVDQINEAV